MFKQVEPIERVHQTLADGRVQIRIGGCEGWRRAIYVAVVLGIGPECPLPEAASTGPCINFGPDTAIAPRTLYSRRQRCNSGDDGERVVMNCFPIKGDGVFRI